MTFFHFIKRYLPKSIVGRFLLIIILPTIIAQLFAIYMFYERHWENVSRHLQTTLAGEIGLLLEHINELPAHTDIPVKNLQHFLLHTTLSFHENAPSANLDNEQWLADYPFLSAYLSKSVHIPYHLYQSKDSEYIFAEFELPNGTLSAQINRKRLETPTTYIYVMWMSGFALILLIISVIFMRNQLRPIVRLADAADKFGKGQPIGDFKPEGATETRKAAKAFLDMKDRIDRQVSQRTTMLSGVSHDLKTPLTRMKLQLALLKPSQENQAMQNDIHEMETMIEGYLDFAKGNEQAVNKPINLAEQMHHIVARYSQKQESFTLNIPDHIIININLNHFKRIITNLIDNALRFSTAIHITGKATSKQLFLRIDDNGPGIDPNQYENVFKPFYRIDHSRNKETGGTGLGLSITRDLVARYGGQITLDKSPLGGLRVTISLPL